MKTHLQLLALLLGVSSIAFAGSDLSSIEQKIESAFYRADATLLAEANAQLSTAAQTTPSTAEAVYLQGFAAFAQTSVDYATNNRKAAQASLEKADTLLASVKGQPWEAEAQGLRGAIAGQLIGHKGGMSAMKLGPKSQELTSDALAAAPNSPRILVYRGIILLNSPEMFGGNPTEAVRLITRAVTLMESANKPPAKLSWGHAYTLAWLAQAKMKLRDWPAAKDAATRALAIEPAYGWINYAILPELAKPH